jgi:2'-5' RNA ligase
MALPPARTDRLFLAVAPDAAARERIHALAVRLRAELALRGHPLGPARYHVTLAFLGDHAGLPQHLVEQVSACAGTIALPPFGIRFDHVASFARGRGSPLVLLGGDGVAGLRALAAALAERLHDVVDVDRRPYKAHLTLLRDDRVVAERPVAPIAWTAHEFVLVHSAVGQGRHTVLARWPLRG